MSYVIQITQAQAADDTVRQVVDIEFAAIVITSQNATPNQGWRAIEIDDGRESFVDWEEATTYTLRGPQSAVASHQGTQAEVEAMGYTGVSSLGDNLWQVTTQASKVQVETWKDSGVATVNEYLTLAEAKTATDSLAESDGYRITDMPQPSGSGVTRPQGVRPIVITERPPLWLAWYEPSDDGGQVWSYVASYSNGFGRTDADRV